MPHTVERGRVNSNTEYNSIFIFVSVTWAYTDTESTWCQSGIIEHFFTAILKMSYQNIKCFTFETSENNYSYYIHRGETIYRVLACKLRGGLEVDSIHIVVIGQQR